MYPLHTHGDFFKDGNSEQLPNDSFHNIAALFTFLGTEVRQSKPQTRTTH
eukprot:m.335560 g.335560  ORF g.335560 m.335560 type:complete len:50 (-) comp17627_c0_seq1:95-244(-)